MRTLNIYAYLLHVGGDLGGGGGGGGGGRNIDEGGRKCFLGNLDFRTDERYIRRKFSKFGEISDVFLPRDYYTNKPRGFGFVTFEDPKDADYAVEEMDGREFDGRKITVNLAKPREERGGGRRRDDRYRGGRDRYRGDRDRDDDRDRDRSRDRSRDRGDRY
mmetsp:Transcript_11826/g.17621  ORF Transcript_11826/g.17621 Transcript_11826/m.17621 type:complete len:161 (+) Transcript_11826:660-1142(+)